MTRRRSLHSAGGREALDPENDISFDLDMRGSDSGDEDTVAWPRRSLVGAKHLVRNVEVGLSLE